MFIITTQKLSLYPLRHVTLSNTLDVHSRELHSTDRKAISYLIFRYRPLDWTEALILVGPSRKILSLTHKVKELAGYESARGNRGHVS